jgi:hypothetical protein
MSLFSKSLRGHPSSTEGNVGVMTGRPKGKPSRLASSPSGWPILHRLSPVQKPRCQRFLRSSLSFTFPLLPSVLGPAPLPPLWPDLETTPRSFFSLGVLTSIDRKGLGRHHSLHINGRGGPCTVISGTGPGWCGRRRSGTDGLETKLQSPKKSGKLREFSLSLDFSGFTLGSRSKIPFLSLSILYKVSKKCCCKNDIYKASTFKHSHQLTRPLCPKLNLQCPRISC